jgi:heme exporter protein A
MPQFTGRDLTCIRGERIVFSGLDFRLGAGGALVVAGPNGSGKSSLLRLMAGLLPAAAGGLDWDGEDVGEDPDAHRGRLHYVGHLDAVKAVLTVAENLAFWAGLRHPGDVGAPVRAALAAFAMEPLAEVPARFLSAGQRRRLNLARLIAASAPLWLLDEPTTGLDAAATAGLEDALARHRAGGGMAVVATHAALRLNAAQHLHLTAYAPHSPAAP